MNTCHYITPLITITILTATHSQVQPIKPGREVAEKKVSRSLTTETTRIIPVNATRGKSVKPRFLTPSRVNGHGQSIDTINAFNYLFSVGHDSAELEGLSHHSAPVWQHCGNDTQMDDFDIWQKKHLLLFSRVGNWFLASFAVRDMSRPQINRARVDVGSKINYKSQPRAWASPGWAKIVRTSAAFNYPN